MAKYRFSYVHRYALWRAYDGRCFYCDRPLDFQDMTIDHIIPECLAEHPDELEQLRLKYDIGDNIPAFQVNDFCNWVPAHLRCNTRKGTRIFPKKITLFILQEVQRRLPAVKQELESLERERTKGRALGSLGTGVERQHVSVQEVRQLLRELETDQHAYEPLVATFGLLVDDVLEGGHLSDHVPRFYPHLCDWLEQDLVKHLATILSTPFHYTEPSKRDGECLSVRMVFPGLDAAELDRFDRSWWEILEVGNFWEILGQGYAQAFGEEASLPSAEFEDTD